MRHGLAFPDAVGGLHGAFALLAALWERECTGAAVHVDLSQLETLLAFAGEALLATSASGVAPARHGNRSPDHAPQGVYPCAGDDAWVAVTVQGDAEWAALVELARRSARWTASPAPTWRPGSAAHDAIDDAVAAWTPTPVGRRRRRRAAGGRHRRQPGLHEPRPRRGRAPRRPRLHRHVGPARRRTAPVPRVPDPLRPHAGAPRPGADAGRRQRRRAAGRSATTTGRSTSCSPAA